MSLHAILKNPEFPNEVHLCFLTESDSELCSLSLISEEDDFGRVWFVGKRADGREKDGYIDNITWSKDNETFFEWAEREISANLSTITSNVKGEATTP